jgi:hypothetical protein
MALLLHELTTWGEVERVAAGVGIVTCIRKKGSDVGANNAKAEETWKAHYPGAIRYFAVMNGDKYESPDGYIRIVRLTESEYTTPQTWCVDFAKPLDYQAITLLAAKLAPWTLLVKKSESSLTKNISLVANWPMVAASYPQLNRYQYKIQSAGESCWLVVPKG